MPAHCRASLSCSLWGECRCAWERRRLWTPPRSFFESRRKRIDDLEYYQERRLKRLGLLDDTGGSTYDDFFKVLLQLCS